MLYRDSVPTPLGRAFTGLYSFGLLYLDARTYELWRRGAPGALTQLAASGLLTLTGLNDTLAFAGLTRAPYLNDLGLLALVLGVGASFVDLHTRSLQALELVRSDLGAARETLVRRERLAALGELSAVVAHEVRNPVAVIFNALPMLKRSLPAEAEQSRALAEIIGEEADRIRRIVDELLDFVRPIELRRDAVDLVRLLSRVSAAIRDESAQAIPFEVAPGAETVEADEHLLGLALSNLIRNALQSGSPRDAVRVLGRAEAGRVHLAVVDRGPGVPEQAVAKLFEPFFTTRPTGTGLGLAFVQRVAEAHGGAVAYAPTLGGGATFTVSLPRA
jgi:signal transduction histidine kinase